jgi:hypothetical protein
MMKPDVKDGTIPVGDEQEAPTSDQFDSIEILAEMSNTKIEMRDIVDKWLLLTYDIPHSKEGDRVRREFLQEATLVGATQHTESVYLLPWTPAAELLALRVGRAGKAVVWTSSLTDKAKAAEITAKYDHGIRATLDEISERIDRILEHEKAGRVKRAAKMLPKTEKMLFGMDEALQARGSQPLILYLTLLKRRFSFLLMRGN